MAEQTPRRTITLPPNPPGPVPGFGPTEPILNFFGAQPFADLVQAGVGQAAQQASQDLLPIIENPHVQLLGTGLLTGGSVAPPVLGLPGATLGGVIKAGKLAVPALREMAQGASPMMKLAESTMPDLRGAPLQLPTQAFDPAPLTGSAPEGAMARDFVPGQEQKAVIGFDPRLALTLSQNLYQGNVGDITLKELIQNSTDAIRGRVGAQNPAMDIWVNPETRQIRVRDNGTGMAPETVMDQFVKLGGSLKGENAAGGFGVAKAIILSNAENLSMRTTWLDPQGRKVTTMLKGSGEDWLDPSKGLSVTSHFDDAAELGTDIDITLKEGAPFGDPMNTVVSPLLKYGRLDFQVNPYRMGWGGTYAPFEVGKTNSTWSWDPYYPNDPWKPLGTVPLEEGQILLYGRGPEQETKSLNAMVLNQGIPQFRQYHSFYGPMKFPAEVVADVRTKLSPEKEGYPFTTSREALRSDVHDQMTEFFKAQGTKGILNENERLNQVIARAPEIQGSGVKFYDFDQRIPMDEVARLTGPGSYLFPLATSIDVIGQRLAKRVNQIQGHGVESQFALGYDTSAFGSNVNLSHGLPADAPKRNLIVLNPYVTAQYVDNLVRAGSITADEATEMFSSSLMATLVHEVAHMGARGHDVNFASEITRGIAFAGKDLATAIDHVNMTMGGSGSANGFIQRLLADNERFGAFKSAGESVFGQAGTDDSARRLSRGPQGGRGGDDQPRAQRP